MKTIKGLLLLCLTGWLLFSAAASAETPEGKETFMKTQTETICTDSFTMDFFRFGRGKDTLIILPGLSVDSVMNYADAVAEAYRPLADDFTIYVFDRRKELPAAYSVREMAEDTVAAIRSLGLDRVSLFGASQGGMIAMVAAIEHPGLVSRLILGSSSACLEPEQYRTVDRWIQLARAGNAIDLYLAFGEAIYPPAVFEQSRDLLAAAAASVTEEDLRRFVILAEGMKGFDVAGRLQEISCPVLVLGSADDRVLGPAAAGQIADRIKDCRLYMYDGWGHAAYDTAPDYKERLLRFLVPESAG